MDDLSKTLYKSAFEVTERCNKALADISEKSAKNAPGFATLEDKADAAFALHQTSELLDELRKKCDALHDHLAKMIGIGWLGRQMQTLSCEPIRTDYVTATPDVKSAVTQPSPNKDYANYRLFMEDLGVPEHLIALHDDKGNVVRRQVVSVDWKGLIEYITELTAQAKPLPRGVDPSKKYPSYELRYRRRKGILEDAEDKTKQSK